MSAEVNSSYLTDHARLLADARLKYAGRLKDTFLRGPARFLLQDQDAAGIEKLENQLVKEIDAALRFSCQVWCRHDTPVVRGLRDLTETTFDSSSDTMELCPAQAPPQSHTAAAIAAIKGAPPGYHGGHTVVMIVQPFVGVNTSGPTKKDPKGGTTAWIKASVLVAAPKAPVQDSLNATTGDPASPSVAYIKAIVGTPSSPGASSGASQGP